MQPIDWLYRTVRIHPDSVAVDAPQARLTYTELRNRVDALAAALQSLEPDPRSRVGVCAHNTLDHLLSILAVMAAGKIWVPLNPLDAAPDLGAKLSQSQPSLIIADHDCVAAVESSGAKIIVGSADARRESGPETIAGLIASHRGVHPVRGSINGSATQAIKFTGGSSGNPKGVLQPYRAWVAGCVNMLHAHGFHRGDGFLLAAPLTHGTSCYVAPMLACGATLVLLGGKARPDSVLHAFEHRGVTATFLPPTLIYMLMSELDGAPLQRGALRLLIYGAAPMPPERIRDAQQIFGPVLAANYGLTEAPQIISALTPDDAQGDRLASAGRAGFTTRVEIMNGAGEIVGPGETGEVVVSGDLVMTGYLDSPQQTKETLHDGWLHTGDLGRMDDQGFLYITDRIKDLIITGGFNVYPGEVERALAAHPAISECVVFGIEDRKWGEAVHAAVSFRNGQSASAEEIVQFAKQRVGSVKAPKRIHFLEELPRSPVGKVQRRKIRELVNERV